MANGILRRLAVAAGTGLAMGVTAGRPRVRPVSDVPAVPDRQPVQHRMPPYPSVPFVLADAADEVLDLEPLLERLERIEARIDAAEHRPNPLLSDLDRRVAESTRELALVRESVADVRRNLGQTREDVPDIVDRKVSARFDDLRSRLDADIESAHQRTLATFERVIDEKVSLRIGRIEQTLGDHATSIEALRVRAADTENNLQRLVAAIEKLCERAQLVPASSEPSPEPPAIYTSRPTPFESQLKDAMERGPVTPVLRQEARPEPPAVPAKAAVPAFAATEAPVQKRSWFQFRN